MPMIFITAEGPQPRMHNIKSGLQDALHQALAQSDGPVTVMVHGYRYQPGHPLNCPHESIFSEDPSHHPLVPHNPRIISWPRRLGMRGQSSASLGLSFGWNARGTIWQAYRAAETAGKALSELLIHLKQLAPERRITVIAHSLGARVALCALTQIPPGTLSTAILLAAAEFSSHAHKAMTAPQGAQTQVLNVTSRENDLYDFLIERLIAPPCAGDRMLGHGGLRLPTLTTLQLDDAQSLTALRQVGYPVAAAQRRICHWSPYLRAGVFPLYRAVLSGALPLAQLRAALPETAAPRWSRLIPSPIPLPSHRLAIGRS